MKAALSGFVSFLTSVKMGGCGMSGPKGGTSSLAVTHTCTEIEEKRA